MGTSRLTEKHSAMGAPEAGQPTAASGDGLHLKALHGVKWATVANWSAQGTGFITMLILARLLVPAEFGIYSIGSAIVMVMAGLSQIGLPLALVQRQQIADGHLHSAFWCVTGAAVLLLAAAVIGRNAIAAAFALPELASLVPVVALSLPLLAMGGIFNAPLMRHLDFRRSAIATSTGAIAGAVAAVAMALAGFGIWSLAAQSLIAPAVALALLVAFSPYRPSWRFSRQRLGELWNFGALSMASDFVALIDVRLGTVLLGGLLGAREAGLYAMSRRVIDMGQQTFVASIGQVAMPAFSRLATQPARMRAAYLNAIQSVAALTVPLFGFLAVMSPEVVVIFLGPAWVEGASVLQFLSLAALVQSYGWITTSALVSLGRVSLRLAIQVLSLVLSIAVLAVTWRHGLAAVALGFLLKAFVMHFVLMATVIRAAGIRQREYFAAIGPVVLVGAAALLLASAIKASLPGLSAAPLTAACLGPAGLGYVLALRLFAPALADRLSSYMFELSGSLRRAGR